MASSDYPPASVSTPPTRSSSSNTLLRKPSPPLSPPPSFPTPMSAVSTHGTCQVRSDFISFFFFSFGDLAMIFLMGFVKFLMGQGIWSGRGTFSVLDKPNTLMEEGRTEPPVLGIGRPPESTAGLFLPRRIGWWGWRKRSCSTLETLLMAWELIGLCTSIALSETPKLLLPPLMANYPPWWASPVWNWIEPKNPSGIEKLN